MKNNKVFKIFFSVSGIIVIAKILGFVKQMVTASVFGATVETDLVSLAQGFIGNLEYLFLQTLVASFLPTYVLVKEGGIEKSKRFVSDAIKLFVVLSVAAMGILMIGAPLFAKIIAPSYSNVLSKQLSKYIVVFAPLLVMFILIALFRALLNANERFIPGEMVGVNQSIIVVVLIGLLASSIGVNVLVISSFVYSIWNVCFLGILSRKQWRIYKGNPLRNADVHIMLKMIPPLLLGYSMVYINQLVDKMLISGLEEGAVTAVGYASTLSGLVTTFISSFCAVLFTYVTRNIVKENHRDAATMAIRTSVVLVTVLLPISIITIVCAEDIVKIVFGRGAFEYTAIKNASHALMGYGVMFVPYAFRELFGQFQYGYQDSKRPMVNSTLGIIANIILSILLCPQMGIFGVTLATSISVIICGILNAYTSKKHNVYLKFGYLGRKIPLWMVGSLVCVVIAKWGIEQWQESHVIIRFGLTVLLSFSCYFLVVSPILWRERFLNK